MKVIPIAFVILMSLVFGSMAIPQQASAAIANGCKSSSFLLLPPWYEYLDVGPKGSDPCAIIGPAGNNPDNSASLDWGKASGRIGLAVVDILLRLGGIVAVGFIIYGGIRLVLAQGEPDKFKQSKDTIINALVGLVIVVVATGAVTFVGSTLIK